MIPRLPTIADRWPASSLLVRDVGVEFSGTGIPAELLPRTPAVASPASRPVGVEALLGPVPALDDCGGSVEGSVP